MRAPLETSVPEYGQGSAPVQAGAQRASEALRLWLVTGIHSLGVDKRRRVGSHSTVRELLVAERTTDGGWSETASALRRHTLHAALGQLSAFERNIVNLAYLEGHSNPQIAAALGVSVTTVRRRLRTALGLLQAYVASSGAWLAAILLLGVALFARWTRGDRLIQSLRAPDWFQPTATVAAGVVAATAVAITISSAWFPDAEHHVPPAASGLLPAVSSGLGPGLLRTFDLDNLATDTSMAPSNHAGATDASGQNHGKHRALGHLKQKS